MSGGRTLGATEIAAAVRAGDLGELEAADDSLRALYSRQAELRASISLVEELPTARVRPGGALAGVPVLVKDLIDTAGLRTTYGSRIFRDHVPTGTAESVQRLQRAGAIVVGKANLHEFAWGLTSRNPHWGDVVNPGDPTRTPGGSSGGNAAAVAAGIVPVGLGTDTAGSLRIPAACCDVVGFKPSNGSVPSSGVFPLAPTLDCVGPIAASVADCALMYSVLSNRPTIERDVRQLRIATTSAELHDLLRDAGIPSTVLDAPVPPSGSELVLPAEAWKVHRDLVGRHAEDYDPNVLEKLYKASDIDESVYTAALGAVRAWRRETDRDRGYDVIVDTTLDIPVPPADVDELEVRERFGRRTRWANLLGWAAVAIGPIHLVGPDDWSTLAVAARLEGLRPRA